MSGLAASDYALSDPIPASTTYKGPITGEVVLIEWTDTNTGNGTFEGTARELMRLQHPAPYHPMDELTFNPYAREGDADWRMLYIGIGDAFTGETPGEYRLLAQQLDSPFGKIFRVSPDPTLRTNTSRPSPNGRYRIPNDNPCLSIPSARGEIWAYGIRNPHRMAWDRDTGGRGTTRLLSFTIGSSFWESVHVIKRAANYGYPVREGTQERSLSGMKTLPSDDRLPIMVTDSLTQGTVRPTYPVVQYKTGITSTGDAIAGGFVYRASRFPALRDKLVFADITTGRIWYSEMSDVIAADDDDPMTQAPLHEMDWDIKHLEEAAFHARGGTGATLPGSGGASGPGRVDVRFAVDSDGEIYVLTKGDGVIRRVSSVK